MLGALAIPWSTAIASNGMRVVAIIVYAVLVVRVAIGIHGNATAMLSDAPVVEAASPDEWGVHAPLTRADALEAGRALGIDEELLELRAANGNGAGRAASPAGVSA